MRTLLLFLLITVFAQAEPNSLSEDFDYWAEINLPDAGHGGSEE